MNTGNVHWSFNIEILNRAMNDLETVCTSEPGTEEFFFLRSEAKVILAEAREALTDLKQQMRTLDMLSTEETRTATHH